MKRSRTVHRNRSLVKSNCGVEQRWHEQLKVSAIETSTGTKLAMVRANARPDCESAYDFQLIGVLKRVATCAEDPAVDVERYYPDVLASLYPGSGRRLVAVPSS